MTREMVELLAPLADSEYREGSIELSQDQWDALRCVLLSLKLSEILGERQKTQAFPKLVAACHAALSVEGLPTPVRKQLERALAIAEF